MQQFASSCFLVLLLSALLFCKTSDTPPDPNYIAGIEAWRTARLDALKRPRGWASLVGLHWLPEGQQSFGISDTADIQLTERAPEVLGIWYRAGDTVRFRPTPGLAVWSVNDSMSFSGGEVRADSDPQPHLLNHQSQYWMVIQRGDQYGVRVWDTLHYARTELTEIPHFPVDQAWALPARFEPAPPGTQMMVDNAVGLTVPVDVAGTVHSAYGQHAIRLVAFDGGPEELFLIFADLTTDITTYSGGRYLYIPRGDADGNTVLDLNKAYNPPCVFTDFATCLLPPEENFIALEVTAGEKMPADH